MLRALIAKKKKKNFIMSVHLHGTTQLHWIDFDEI
jgi:hypothetical protein